MWSFDVNNVYISVYVGLYVHGQAGFLSGTTINCYGKDSTCSATPTVTTLNYNDSGVYQYSKKSANPCCYQGTSFYYSYYYSVDGGICQLCGGIFINSQNSCWTVYCLEPKVWLTN